MKDLKPAILLFVALTVVCGGIYPAAVTLVAGIAFPRQAAGSFVKDAGGREIGSALIGQPFSDPKYFWPRPSATGPFAYNPGGSGGANLGPTNPAFLAAVADRVAAQRAAGIAGAGALRSRRWPRRAGSTRTSRPRGRAPRWRGWPGPGASPRRSWSGSSPPASRSGSSASSGSRG